MVLGPPRARRRRGREQGAEGELLWGGEGIGHFEGGMGRERPEREK